jgi:hypothetical protein
MEGVTDSEAPQSDRVTNPPFERGGVWTSSFHGDRYTQEDIYKVSDHVKVGFLNDCHHFVFRARQSLALVASNLSPMAFYILAIILPKALLLNVCIYIDTIARCPRNA